MLYNKFSEIRDCLERYNPGTRPMTWMSIFAFSLHKGLFGINYGRSGDGKSRSTTELARHLNLLRPEDVDQNGYCVSPVVIAPNNCTDRVFFDFLVNHRNKCVIIDDASKLSPQQISFLKEAMGETGEIEYTTSRDAERNRVVFTGTILMNTNYEKQEQAINTRAYMNYYYFDHEEMLKKRQAAREYEMDSQLKKDAPAFALISKAIEKMIKENVAGKEMPELTREDKARVYAAVDSIDVDFYSQSSMRDDPKAMRLARLFKHMFGSLTDEMWEEVDHIIKHYLTSGVLDTTSCIVNVVDQYFRKHSTNTIRYHELSEIIKHKYPNHNIKAWLDTAMARRRILRGNNNNYVMLPNTQPTISV